VHFCKYDLEKFAALLLAFFSEMLYITAKYTATFYGGKLWQFAKVAVEQKKLPVVNCSAKSVSQGAA
jgi:hypothetical protein